MLNEDTISRIEELLFEGTSVVHISEGHYTTVKILKDLGISGKLSHNGVYYTFTLKE